MTLKERAEKSSVLFVLGLLLAGFLAGFGAHKTLVETTGTQAAEPARDPTPSMSPDLGEGGGGDEGIAADLRAKLTAAEEENSRLRSQVQRLQADQSRTEPTRDTPQMGSSPLVKTVDDFDFKFQACEREAGYIDCWAQVINRKFDREIMSNTESRIIDAGGETFMAHRGLIAGNEFIGGIVRVQAPKDVPIRFGIRFEVEDPDVQQLALFEVNFSQFKVQWHNLPVS